MGSRHTVRNVHECEGEATAGALWHRLLGDRPRAVAVPEGATLIRTALGPPQDADFHDAWQLDLLPGMPEDPDAWTGVLRGAFPVLARSENELLLDVDTAGVRARASIHVDRHARSVTLSTVALTGTRRGRLYFAAVSRVHPLLARTMLRREHRRIATAAPGPVDRERAGAVSPTERHPGGAQ